MESQQPQKVSSPVYGDALRCSTCLQGLNLTAMVEGESLHVVHVWSYVVKAQC